MENKKARIKKEKLRVERGLRRETSCIDESCPPDVKKEMNQLFNEYEPENYDPLENIRLNERQRIFNEVMGVKEVQDLPDITAEEVALRFNKVILERGKLPKEFSILDKFIDSPDIVRFDKKLKLYTRYERREFSKDTDFKNVRMGDIAIQRYTNTELMNSLKKGEIFVMDIMRS